jgi:hypothetical protein
VQLQQTLKLVDHFSKSNQQFKKLKDQQKNMDTYDAKQPVGVVVDVGTRWWSTYSMWER